MTRNTLLICLIIISRVSLLQAQDVIGTTRLSQKATISQRIGTTDITIAYSSPLAKGRQIFGNIVPYDFVVDGKEYPWRAGSNENTTIKFTHPVIIEGQKLDSGKYGLHILVSEMEWTFIFSKNANSWGSFQYDKNMDALRVVVPAQEAQHQNWLSYDFQDIEPSSAVVELHWATRKASFKVETNVVSNILADLVAKKEKSAEDYMTLAKRTLQQDSSALKKALYWTNISLDSNAYFHNRMFKSQLLDGMGKSKESKQLKQLALDSAKGFDIYYYALGEYFVGGNKKKAKTVLDNYLKLHPNDWIVHLAYGEYYIQENNQAKVVEHFKKSFENSPDNWRNYARYLYLSNKISKEHNRLN